MTSKLTIKHPLRYGENDLHVHNKNRVLLEAAHQHDDSHLIITKKHAHPSLKE